MSKTKNFAIICLTLISAWRLADKILDEMHQRGEATEFSAERLKKMLLPGDIEHGQAQAEPAFIPGGLIVHADNEGRFHSTVLINNIPMACVLDTGATGIAIPVAMANQARLPMGEISQGETANGSTNTILTQVESLKIGSAELKNMNADVLYNLDEVLIGMSVLKKFSISVQNDTMTLASLDGNAALMTSETEPRQQAREMPPILTNEAENTERQGGMGRTWKKTVICDNSGCKTRYGD